MKIIVTFIALILFPLSFQLRAQTAAAAVNDKVQKARKTLVSVPVTVSDRDGRYIPNLKKRDFAIYRDGVRQDIEFFATEGEPLTVALLIDTSGSTKTTLEKIKDAAEDFIELLGPEDQALVATFDAKVTLLNPLSSDQKTLKNAVSRIRTAEHEGTVLLSAIEQVAQRSFADVEGRKVIVLLSDGKDFGSSVAKNELLSRLEESDVSIYTIFYQTGTGFNKLTVDAGGEIREAAESKPAKKKEPKRKKNYSILIPMRGDVFTPEEIKLTSKAADIEAVNSLREISDMTAGRFYLSNTPDLNDVFKKIAGEMRQQYRLGFYTRSAGGDASVHDISVRVERPDVVVRARGKFRAVKLSGF